MVNTLFEIDQKIKEFCQKSAIVQEYNFEDFPGEFTSANHKYPLIWTTPAQLTFVNGQLSFVVTLAVMDIQYQKSDLMKILSDTAIILQELLTYVDEDSENFYYWSVISGIFKPFSMSKDNSCGWQGDITFQMKFEASQDDIRLK